MTARQPDLLDHEYDGIHEYDNPTPAWWNWLFAVTIIFSVLYMYINLGDSNDSGWKAAQLADFQRIFGRLGQLTPDEPTIARMMADAEMMAVAAGIFAGNCAACHARDGGGSIGPKRV